MAFVSRLINERLANLIRRFNAPTQIVKHSENDYPFDSEGDHYRFYI